MYITEEEIQNKVDEIAREIKKDYLRDSPLALIGVLKGGFIFTADLARQLFGHFSMEIGFIEAKSYDGVDSGVVQLIYDGKIPVHDKHVIIVDDIMETGKTAKWLTQLFKAQKALSVKTVTLLDKVGRRQVPIDPDYSGFEVPDYFFVGYGLDFRGFQRETPYIVGLDKTNL